MRLLVCSILIATCAAAAASSYRDVQKAVNDDQLLISAGVEPERAVLRLQCAAAVLDSDDRPNSFDCVYVQTPHDLNLFSLEDGYLMSELRLTLGNMDGVALQQLGKYSQVQVFDGDRIAAFYVYDKTWIDAKQTEAVYQWLVDHGVRKRQPVKWIGR